jgi:gamma-glutamylcyclotransferase (GGCT)/AIG2-like uncharacterized protein YtfP
MSQRPTNLFVYGTLKDARLVRALTGRTFPRVAAELWGWRLVPTVASASGYPEVEPSRGQRVQGYLLLGVDPESLRALDAYEDGYRRRRVRVRTGGRTVQAEVYVPERWARVR